MADIEKIGSKLSPLERKIVPHLKSPINEIKEKTKLDNTSLLRGLKFLENKKILTIKVQKKRIVELATNGVYYKKNHLPERNLLDAIKALKFPTLEELKKASKLSDNEFKVSLGVLKSKALIEIKNGKVALTGSAEEVAKKTFEELLIDALPLEEAKLEPEQQFALQALKKRKEIVEITEKNIVNFKLTELGRKIAGKKIKGETLEEVTPEVIRDWKKGKKFREYDIHSGVPKLYGGKRHFVNRAISKGRRIWLDLGFKEMTGNKVQTSFWNFDALFTAQDHPVRELHDTFYINDVEGTLPDEKLVKRVKDAHEGNIKGSKGWQYKWDEEDAKRVVLRTHTTCLSAQTLANLDVKKDLPAKYFAIGRNFRNETVDWSHGFEFNQSEGIVIDKDANLRNLIGYLKEFAAKMGFDKFRIQPAYFPYTEPSVEGAVWNEEKKQWVEVIAAGIFRPEVTEPLLGEAIPVLAWGPGFDRLMILAQGIKDLREVYENDVRKLRESKIQ